MGAFQDKLITQEGKDALRNQVQVQSAKLRRMSNERPSSDAISNGKTCGCCQIMDAETAEYERLARQISGLEAILAEANVAPRPSDIKTLQIGHTAHFSYRPSTGDRNKKVQFSYRIVGSGEGDCRASPPSISYDSPLAQLFLGKERGTKEQHTIDGKVRMLKLARIQM